MLRRPTYKTKQMSHFTKKTSYEKVGMKDKINRILKIFVLSNYLL
ncbi:hypothetical protein DAT606_p1076 (plasmid) [Melissococcus plutonius]|nr:hypothetical protein DAT585_p1073 [Melissococcus plutonius]BBD17630.1 hypothetical protein DAT606_p1076 [Melissococcus plutonius]BBP08185.1 hypothetical protein DAT1033_p1076 [Melissococcus plutonius]